MFSKLGKRSVLRTGYAAVIAVLVFSAFEAYRIQLNVSQQHLEIYRHYVDEEDALTTLRRNVWLAGNYVRDFFIRTTPEQGQTLRSQLEALQTESTQALDRLARISPQSPVFPALRKSINEFWSVTPRATARSRRANTRYWASRIRNSRRSCFGSGNCRSQFKPPSAIITILLRAVR